MNVWSRKVLPLLIAWAMRDRDLVRYRKRLVERAQGRVLEIGVGSGLNLPLYRPPASLVIGLDPSAELLRRARAEAAASPVPVCLVQGSAEAIPLAAGSVDTVVMAWTLCSVPDAAKALAELRRVLRPEGRLLFVEHGLSDEPGVAGWQQRLDPFWLKVSCHMNLKVGELLQRAGFVVEELETGYVGKGPRALTFLYEGSARPA
ncbi:class I SAM-dependent methyltransferase [Marinimicrococcus flavescens]|uniref:Class I SAM-dependent methyltransferase n=1 Tax=Marinimicrococcus flavescens TaxID=3031815 RepID=A0AAP3XRS9_9PROT|nr:class I SAM-dependent methyltransferase [Marinimicrococcus flavescens]